MYERILVATDLLASSEPALRAAMRLADPRASRIAVLYVVEVWMVERQWFASVSEEDVAFHRAFLGREEEAAKGELERQIERARAAEGLRIQVDPIVRVGRAAETIESVAAERECDLVVVGTRRRPGTLGSVAEQVVRTARRHVLVVSS